MGVIDSSTIVNCLFAQEENKRLKELLARYYEKHKRCDKLKTEMKRLRTVLRRRLTWLLFAATDAVMESSGSTVSFLAFVVWQHEQEEKIVMDATGKLIGLKPYLGVVFMSGPDNGTLLKRVRHGACSLYAVL